jgi:riboflavin kinase/FMN adenylyltransferase
VKISWLPTPTHEGHVERSERRVAVGMFDGVHLGHREVIRGCDSVLTFDPHPSSVVAPQHTPKLLNSLRLKAELIAALGVQETIVIPFDAAFAARSAQEFVDDVLVGALGASHVAVGENFRFGNRAKGDPQMLQADPRFSTRVVPLLEVEGEIVSSSHIRGLVAAGEVEQARRFLGTPFQLRNEVVPGDRRGRELGFPTANLIPDDALVCPGHGVYACLASGPLALSASARAGTADAGSDLLPADPGPDILPAAVSIGVRPTFLTGRGELIEAYVLDFEGDLYGLQLRLEFLARLRGERRFASAGELVQQMRRDVRRTREIAAQASAHAAC